jgi:hypothetical protein
MTLTGLLLASVASLACERPLPVASSPSSSNCRPRKEAFPAASSPEAASTFRNLRRSPNHPHPTLAGIPSLHFCCSHPPTILTEP